MHQALIESEPPDPSSLDGISVELSRNGVWLEVRHANGSWDVAYLTGTWLRLLAAASVTARTDAFELLRRSLSEAKS